MSTPDRLVAKLDQLTGVEQRDKRYPSLAAAVLRDGELIWEKAVGAADVEGGVEATPDTQYRVGSITKTFTAAAIMQLRDAGKLDLEDTLDQHVEGAAYTPVDPPASLARVRPAAGDARRLVADAALRAAGRAARDARPRRDGAPAGARFHYSNLAFALLGIVVERVSGDAVHGLRPRALLRAARPDAHELRAGAAGGEGLRRAAVRRRRLGRGRRRDRRVGVRGQLWGTVGDLCRWGAFLADPDEAILAKKSAEEMRTVQVIDEHERWLSGYGLGLQLRRDGDRILAGHSGSMPGFIARLYFSPREKVVAAALTNASEAALALFGLSLVRTTVDEWPVAPEAWRVGEPPPADVVPLLGVWFMEGGADDLPLARRPARDALARRRRLAAAGGVREGDGRPLAHRLRPGARRGTEDRARRGRLDRAARLGGLSGHARAGPVARSGAVALDTRAVMLAILAP